MSDSTVNLAALEVVARAEKRMRGHIARYGIDAEALAIFATYERMYARAAAEPVDVVDEAFAAARAVAA